jgi:hypothetical protein
VYQQGVDHGHNRGMKAMHAHMERLYEAARAAGRITGDADQTAMARLLNVAPQNVNNWEKRGPSKEALLDAQAAFGVNATWVMTGAGPMFIGGAAPRDEQWPFTRLDIRRVLRLAPEDRAFVEGKLEAAVELAEGRVIAEKSQAGNRAA